MRGFAACLVVVIGCATADHTPDGAADAPLSPDAFRPPDAPLPDAMVPVDALPVGPGFFLDDDAAHFTGAIDGAVVSEWGGVEPMAFYTGGLLARASDDGTIVSGGGAAWIDFQAMTLTTAATVYGGLDLSWGAVAPPGLGLTGPDGWTVGIEGQIYLTAGTWTFHLLVDDHGFIELAQPGAASYSRVASGDNGVDVDGAFAVTSSGWHPIRILVSKTSGNGRMRVEATPPGGSRGPIPKSALRARADAVQGLYLIAYDDSHMLGSHQVTIDGNSPANYDWGITRPGDLGLTGSDTFTTRWVGQLRVDTAGSYIYRFVSDDGQRLWIDGVKVLDDWDETSHDNTTASLNLDAGWHDIVIDHMEIDTSARATLTIASGPEGSGAGLPVSKLRPVVPRAARLESGFDRTDRAVADLGSAESSAVLDAPPGAKVTGLVVSYTFDHQYHGDVELRLIGPDGSNVLLRDNIGGSASGSVSERVTVTALDGANVAGTWTLRMSDTASLHTGTLRDFQLTVFHRSGEPPIMQTASYESEVKDLGPGIRKYDAFTWGSRVAAGSTIRLRVRSGDDAQAVTAAEWSVPLVNPSGGSPPVLPKRYFQYRIEFTSDGDGAPSVDWVRLDYTTDDAQ